MADSKVDEANALKNEGNKAFAAHDWRTAIEFYTKAIELNDKEPTFYSNRAQVCQGGPGLCNRCARPTDGERRRRTSSPKHMAMRLRTPRKPSN